MLVFVPTPIGNLEDISFRALKALEDADIILCEDTRVTKKLISLLNEKLNQNISIDNKTFFSVHSHNESNFLSEKYIQIYKTKNVIYLSDAGMPCVSDPGALLVNVCIENKIDYDVLPGANALLTAFAMSGFETKEFTFYGFLPHKPINRKAPLMEILNSSYVTILYESTHRIIQLMEEISKISPQKIIFAVKELTKLHQSSYKMTAVDLLQKLKESDIRGEWVVVVEPNEQTKGEHITLDDIKDLKLPPKQKAKLIAKLTGQNIKDIYNNLSK